MRRRLIPDDGGPLKTFACNRSRCGRLGTILAFVPESD